MSTAAQLPATGDGLSDALAQAHSALDRLLTEAATAATHPRARSTKQWRETLQEAERLHRRTDSARLRIIAAAEDQQAPASAGFADTSSWITRQTHTGHRQAASDATLAATLGVTDLSPLPGGTGADGADGSLLGINGTGGPDSADGSGGAGGTARPAAGAAVRSVTGRALDEGSISVAHAKVIHATLRDLPTDLSTADRGTCEVELVALAKTRTPAALRKAARRVLDQVVTDAAVVDAHENATLEAEEDRAWNNATFWVKDNHDGTMTGQFTVPWHAGATLKMNRPESPGGLVGYEASGMATSAASR